MSTPLMLTLLGFKKANSVGEWLRPYWLSLHMQGPPASQTFTNKPSDPPLPHLQQKYSLIKVSSTCLGFYATSHSSCCTCTALQQTNVCPYVARRAFCEHDLRASEVMNLTIKACKGPAFAMCSWASKNLNQRDPALAQWGVFPTATCLWMM